MVCCHKILNCLNYTDFWKDKFKKILSLLFNFDFTLSISGFLSEISSYSRVHMLRNNDIFLCNGNGIVLCAGFQFKHYKESYW